MDGPAPVAGAGRSRSSALGTRPRRPDLQGALEDAVETLAAGVHDAGILEHRQQRGRPLHGAGGRGDDVGQHGLHVRLAAGGGLGCLGGIADDGQDGALHRASARHRRRPPNRGAGPSARCRPLARRRPSAPCGHAPDDLREDDAAVAARAAQRAAAEGVRDAVRGRAAPAAGARPRPGPRASWPACSSRCPRRGPGRRSARRPPRRGPRGWPRRPRRRG